MKDLMLNKDVWVQRLKSDDPADDTDFGAVATILHMIMIKAFSSFCLGWGSVCERS